MGIFSDAGKLEMNDEPSLDEQWNWFKDHKVRRRILATALLDMKHLQQGPDIRVRALFVKNMSGPTLQMLGGKYVINFDCCHKVNCRHF
jgi:hypothetical protein